MFFCVLKGIYLSDNVHTKKIQKRLCTQRLFISYGSYATIIKNSKQLVITKLEYHFFPTKYIRE